MRFAVTLAFWAWDVALKPIRGVNEMMPFAEKMLTKGTQVPVTRAAVFMSSGQ